MRSLLLGFLLALFCVSLIACAVNYPEPKAKPETVSGWYIAGAGETLSSISVLFYGDAQYWHHLRELNVEMGILENSSLNTSDRIFIPNSRQNIHLLTTTEAGTTLQSTRLNSFLKV